MAETVSQAAQIWMAEMVSQAAQISSDQLKLPEQQTPRKSAKSKEHKEVQLVDSNPEKTALIGANLDANRKTRSSGF